MSAPPGFSAGLQREKQGAASGAAAGFGRCRRGLAKCQDHGELVAVRVSADDPPSSRKSMPVASKIRGCPMGEMRVRAPGLIRL